MRTGELEHLFGVSSTTIRQWINRFGAYMSEGALKTATKQRTFTEEDVIVLGTIAKLSAEGLNYDSIQSRLEEGFRVDRPEVTNWGVDRRMVPAATVEHVLDSSQIRIELEQVRADRDKLADLLAEASAQLEAIRQKYDAAQLGHAQEVKTLQEQIAALQRQLGQAEGELHLRRDQEKKRRWPFG